METIGIVLELLSESTPSSPPMIKLLLRARWVVWVTVVAMTRICQIDVIHHVMIDVMMGEQRTGSTVAVGIRHRDITRSAKMIKTR